MNELFKALKNFIVRDIIYIIGGASVILSYLYLFDKISIIEKCSTFGYLYIAGIGYAIGYCIQDIFSVFGLTTTEYYFEVPYHIKQIYEHFARQPWKDVPKFGMNEVIQINEKAHEDNKYELQRIISLMQVGTTMGPCAILSGLLLYCKFPFIFLESPYGFSLTGLKVILENLLFVWALAGVVILIGILLILLGWLKAAQQMKFTYDLYLKYCENPPKS